MNRKQRGTERKAGKLGRLLVSLLLIFGLTACGSSSAGQQAAEPSQEAEKEEAAQPAGEATAQQEQDTEEAEKEPVELIVFAAASMTETLNEIARQYETVAPEVTLIFNFDSSGTLQTQIEEGADCDLFISAGQKQMDALAEGGYLDEESRMDLLENRVTLCVPDGNPAGVESFDAMAQGLQDGSLFMAMGNGDVPVGQYTQRIFEYYELDEEAISQSLTYGANVKEVTTQVKEGSVDCGVIYCTDAFSAELEIVDYATAEMCGQVIYPAAVLKDGAHREAAQEFLTYLTTQDCMEIFETVGFSAAP